MKKISDLLTETVPKPGVPADVQKMLNEHFGAKRSVIELEELKLPDSCFLPANDLTHSFTSYLKEICPKWAKLRKNHTEKSSVVMLVICGSALRCLELIRYLVCHQERILSPKPPNERDKSMATFKGDGKVMKLFAKHLKIQEQMQMLEKDVVHVGVGTPGRIKALIQQGRKLQYNLPSFPFSSEGLKLTSLKYFILDWNHRDQKLRRLIDIPEVQTFVSVHVACWVLM
ncbi:hypothetical protein L345_07998, partial [Ophiophagus hannah]